MHGLHRILDLALGFFLIACAFVALRSGSATLIYRPITRRDDPWPYWITFAVCVIGGVYLAGGALFPALVGS